MLEQQISCHTKPWQVAGQNPTVLQMRSATHAEGLTLPETTQVTDVQTGLPGRAAEGVVQQHLHCLVSPALTLRAPICLKIWARRALKTMRPVSGSASRNLTRRLVPTTSSRLVFCTCSEMLKTDVSPWLADVSCILMCRHVL